MDMLLIGLEKSLPWFSQAGWWLPALILGALFFCAVVDAFTARVPDVLILAGFLVLTGGLGFTEGWPLAAERLAEGLAAAFVLSGLNHLWYKAFKKDGFGMGDAKWTGLSVACFGLMPSVLAWIIGSWIGVFWMIGARLCGRKLTHVHFAPFLFSGLMAGLYVANRGYL